MESAKLFAQKGFAATSVREITQAASATNPMLYDYFGSKEGLLAALTEDIVHELSLALFRYSHSEQSVDAALEGYARKAAELVLDERHVAVIRVIISEVWRSPKLGYSYYQLGPKAVQRQFADFLEIKAKAGQVEVEDRHQRNILAARATQLAPVEHGANRYQDQANGENHRQNQVGQYADIRTTLESP